MMAVAVALGAATAPIGEKSGKVAGSTTPLPAQAGDAVPAPGMQRQIVAASSAYFAEKDGGRLDVAYRAFAPSVRAYLTPELYRNEAAQFAAVAGRQVERRIVRMTWEQDPAEAAVPGLYVAADFVGRSPGIRLLCGYLMWHREADGAFRIVREEQSFLDEATARRMTPERLRPLPRQFGCPEATATLE